MMMSMINRKRRGTRGCEIMAKVQKDFSLAKMVITCINGLKILNEIEFYDYSSILVLSYM